MAGAGYGTAAANILRCSATVIYLARYEDQDRIAADMMAVFCEFGQAKDRPADSDEAQKLVKKLQDFITEHYYACTDEILAGLGEAYGCGGEFTVNISTAAGEGSAEYAAEAIRIYCNK